MSDTLLVVGDEVWLSGLLEPRWLPVIGTYRDTHVLVQMTDRGDERWWTLQAVGYRRAGRAGPHPYEFPPSPPGCV